MRKSAVISGCVAVAVGFGLAGLVQASPYTVAYTDGGSWNTVYGQGFSTELGANPLPSANAGDPVTLSQFQFYKSGNADTASNVQLAIFNTMYPNTAGLTTSDSSFVGLSTNTIANTTSLNSGDAITFNFNNLPLIYGNDYGAFFVNVSGNAITPVLVSALTANYTLGSDGNYHPATNYGTETDYQYATTSYIASNGYFNAFSYCGDANFTATLNSVPEPASLALIGALGVLGIRRRRD